MIVLWEDGSAKNAIFHYAIDVEHLKLLKKKRRKRFHNVKRGTNQCLRARNILISLNILVTFVKTMDSAVMDDGTAKSANLMFVHIAYRNQQPPSLSFVKKDIYLKLGKPPLLMGICSVVKNVIKQALPLKVE
eukprot:TRINITY_DN1031_c0_g1_i3.p4 TRINITY_DN1031_c0_g1~~TRINITY_DN1031_c0_g1_i3.p4  ORF type:complete len:133 (-),score=4.30 TRINITY_DN1031_c0_g1_i3:192-590(-)